MSRNEVFTFKCDRCGKQAAITDGSIPEELKGWNTLKVMATVNEQPTWGDLFGAEGKHFDLCSQCSLEFREMFMSYLPEAIRKAFEQKDNPPAPEETK